MNQKKKIVQGTYYYPTPNGRNALYIDSSGKIINNKYYFDAKPFSDGLAAVRLLEYNNLWGYIDYNGKVVIDPQFEYAGDFRSGLALVIKQGTEAYIEKNGRLIWVSKIKK